MKNTFITNTEMATLLYKSKNENSFIYLSGNHYYMDENENSVSALACSVSSENIKSILPSLTDSEKNQNFIVMSGHSYFGLFWLGEDKPNLTEIKALIMSGGFTPQFGFFDDDRR